MDIFKNVLPLLEKLSNPTNREENILNLKEFQFYQTQPKFIVSLVSISSPASSLPDHIRLLAAVCLKNTILNKNIPVSEEEIEFLKIELISVIFSENNDKINEINCLLISYIGSIHLFEGKW
jgi:hypothetical protein